MNADQTDVQRFPLYGIIMDVDKDQLIIRSPGEVDHTSIYLNRSDLLDGSVQLRLAGEHEESHFLYRKTAEGKQVTIVTDALWIVSIEEWVGYGQAIPYAEVRYRHGRYCVRMATPRMPDIYFEPIQVGIRIHLIPSDESTVTVQKSGVIELRGTDDLIRMIREGTLPEAHD